MDIPKRSKISATNMMDVCMCNIPAHSESSFCRADKFYNLHRNATPVQVSCGKMMYPQTATTCGYNL